MKTWMLAAALAAGLAAPAWAGPMDAAFGNTIVTTYPDGAVSKVYLEPDGSYRSIARDGREDVGTWKAEKGRLCYYPDGAPKGRPICAVGLNKKVGDTWKVFQDDGASIKITIAAGR